MTKRDELKARLATQGGKQKPEAAASGYVPAPSRRGKVLLAVYCDPAVREQVRAAALKKQTTAQALVLDALNEYFKSDPDLRPIA